MGKSTTLIILIVVLVFGALFRLMHINDESLWLDEGVTYYNSSSEDGYSGVWENAAKLDQSPPGLYFIYHDYLKIFGENELGFRLIPVVFSVLSILFLFLLMSEMFEPEVGLIAAALLAINPFHIGFSIEARQYVLLSLESLIALWALFKATKTDGRGYGYWLVFTLCSIAGLYTHNFYFFVLLACAAVFFILLPINKDHRWGKFLMAFLSALVALIAYIPWTASLMRQLSVDRYWMADITISDLKNYFIDFAAANDFMLLSLIGLAVIGFFWTISAVRDVEYRKILLSSFALAAFLAIGIGVPFVYSIVFEPILKDRYVVYLLPIFMALASLGIYFFRRFSLIFPVIIFAVFVGMWQPWNASAYPVEIGEDFRGLVAMVEREAAPIVLHTPSMAHVINFYAEESTVVAAYPASDDLSEYAIIESPEEKQKYQNYIADFNNFYLVVNRSKEQPGGLLYIWSDELCAKNVKKSVNGLDVWYFQDCSL